jgi:hypothetical protein
MQDHEPHLTRARRGDSEGPVPEGKAEVGDRMLGGLRRRPILQRKGYVVEEVVMADNRLQGMPHDAEHVKVKFGDVHVLDGRVPAAGLGSPVVDRTSRLHHADGFCAVEVGRLGNGQESFRWHRHRISSAPVQRKGIYDRRTPERPASDLFWWAARGERPSKTTTVRKKGGEAGQDAPERGQDV